MKPRTRIILLSILSILIVITIVLGVTYSFMQANIDSSEVTEVTLSSCAKITLEDAGVSINLNNASPMSKNRALQTTPYSFTVTSSCEESVGFNLYLATLDTNTLDASNIHYLIAKEGTKEILTEGILGEASNVLNEFTPEEQTQLNSGIKGNFATIYKIYNIDLPLKGQMTYDLYLYIDSEVTDESTMGKTFNAGIAIKSYNRETSFADYLITDIYMGTDGNNNLYYHDGQGTYLNADQEAKDNSYRFSGGDYQVTDVATQNGLTKVVTSTSTDVDGVINFYCNGEKQYVGYACGATSDYYYTTAYSETNHFTSYEDALIQAVNDGYLTNNNIKNFVCFGPGADNENCSEDNLYRIIGIFDGQVKLIKYTHATPTIFGSDGDYNALYTGSFWSGMRNNANTVYRYYWNYNNTTSSTNDWKSSRLNITNLNTNYWNYLGNDWQNLISNHTWQIGGNTLANIKLQSANSVYNNELVNPALSITYQDEIGLMYISDYMYAASPNGWTTSGNEYNTVKGNNWLYMGMDEWAITPCYDSTDSVFFVISTGYVENTVVYNGNLDVRPVFYLNSNVKLMSGNGSIDNPYRIA